MLGTALWSGVEEPPRSPQAPRRAHDDRGIRRRYELGRAQVMIARFARRMGPTRRYPPIGVEPAASTIDFFNFYREDASAPGAGWTGDVDTEVTGQKATNRRISGYEALSFS
jgi:hypothetical protein